MDRAVQRGFSVLIAALAAVVVVACGGDDGTTRMFRDEPTLSGDFTTPAPFPLSVTRSDGKQLTLNSPPSRIVSIPSWSTEIIYDLGGDAFLAAIGQDPDLPAEAQSFETKLAPSQVNADAIAALTPDLVIVDRDDNGIVGALDARNVPVLYRSDDNVKTLFDVFGEVRILGAVTGRTDAAVKLLEDLNERVRKIEDALAGVRLDEGPSLYHEAGPDFRSVSDATLVGDIYRILRARNIAGAQPDPVPLIGERAVIAANPAVIVVAHRGASVEQVKARPGWADIDAVLKSRIFIVDPALLRPAPRIVEALEQLAKDIYPTAIR